MSIFGWKDSFIGKKRDNNEGGIMDMIRCDKKDFLIWKWRPDASASVGKSKKENSIRIGSSLRVRPGQAAVFLYKNNGDYDIIIGPYDDVLKTDNMPIMSSIIGSVYNGGTPFQAEVYYINLARVMELPFVIPFFRVIPFESEYKAYDVRVAVKGSLAFTIPTDSSMIKYFLESWGMVDTTIDEFNAKVRSLLIQEIKQIVTNAPKDTGIFIMHFNQLIGEMGRYILSRIQERIMQRFGVLATDILIEDIRYDEESEGYQRLKYLTEEQSYKYNLENEKTTLLEYELQRDVMAKDVEIRNLSTKGMTNIQLEHMKDMSTRMREEAQFAQRMQSEQAARLAELRSESTYLNAHSLNKQTEVLKVGMENIGNMSSMNIGGSDGHMNPAGMMTGMVMGASMGKQVGEMMAQMGQTMRQGMDVVVNNQTPPPIPASQQVLWYVFINDSQLGPYDVSILNQMITMGQINGETLVWSAGMLSWEPIKKISALGHLLKSSIDVPPPIPNIP